MSYTLYIVVCADGSYYTGIATDVARRLLEHNGEKGPKVKGRGARYTASRRPVRLLYHALYTSKSEALKAELRVKQLTRSQKQRLIDSAGPAAAALEPARP